jgi:hypothetical protein
VLNVSQEAERCPAVQLEGEIRKALFESGLTNESGWPLYRMPSARCTMRGNAMAAREAAVVYSRYQAALKLARERWGENR